MLIDDFDILGSRIEEMVKEKKVDVSIVSLIDKIITDCQETGKGWIQRGDITAKEAFLPFHAARNSRLILEKMKERILESEAMKGNPHVCVDALTVIPPLTEICTLVSSFIKERPKEIGLILLDKVSDLRSVAEEVSMLPSIEEELEGIDKKKFETIFSKFSRDLQANIE